LAQRDAPAEREGAQMMPGHAQDNQQIAAIIEQYRRGFATLDVAALTGIWDQGYGPSSILPRKWPSQYRAGQVSSAITNGSLAFLNGQNDGRERRSVHVLGEVAYAFLSFHFEGEVNGRPHIADGRVTFLLRRTSEAWKVIHYHESRPGDRLSEA
jgi:ketosteroid isomerase-like protein